MDIYIVLLIIVVVGRILFYTTDKKEPSKTKKRQYGIISQTNQSHLVRSSGEKQIADYLASLGIVYMYEPKLGPFRPDFYLPDFQLVIEYYGMATVNNQDGAIYRRKMEQKHRYYMKNNIQVISILPNHMKNEEFKLLIIQHISQ